MSKLVNGNIPSGTACPFIDNCKFKVHTCPGVDGKTKPNSFSCAAARLHDMLDRLPSAGPIVQKTTPPAPIQPFGEEIVIKDDEGYTD